MQEYVAMWKNFANFSDRTSVRGYWMAVLFNFLAALVLGVLAAVVRPLAALSGLYALAALIPGLAISIRRLRDAGKPWYAIFITFVPLVGWIILLVWLCSQTKSTEGAQV